MGGDEYDVEQPPRQHRGRAHHFHEGSRVEVLTNDDDMGGVYFSATVIERPVCARRIKRRERLYVKYNDLLAFEDRPDPLLEYVDISSVRQAPPSLAVTKRFAANDVVNAFYNDGWWKGVVSRVVGGGGGSERFVVIFEKPPDELEFRAVDLRPHWDWVDGVWAGLENLGGVVFAVGEKVEVSFEGDDAWFPAVIALDLGNGRYLVEFKDKNGSLVRDEVDFANVRPCPPVLEERRFGVNERVEAFFDFRWRSGLIMEKKVKDNSNGYDVFFENLKLEKVFDDLEVRAYMDWKDGKWFVACPLTSNSETPSSSVTPKKHKGTPSSSIAPKKHKGTPSSSVAPEKHKGIPSFLTKRRRSDSKGSAALRKHKGQNEHAKQETEVLAIEKYAPQDEDLRMRVENVEYIGSAALKKHKGENEYAYQDTEILAIEKFVPQDEDPRMRVENVEDIGSAALKKHKGENEHANQETEVLAIEKFVPQVEDPRIGVENVEDIQTSSVIGSSNQEIEPLPIGKIVCQDENPVEIVSVQENIDGSNLVPQSLVSSVSVDEGSITPKEVLPDSGWPFVKHSFLWKNIGSMEVLRKIPQKPHFQPLSLFKEPEREGLAIGFMVTLSDVVERSCSLKISDPKCVVEDSIEELNPTFLKLEKHGFDLRMVRERMAKLLEAKDIEEKLVEHKCKKSKIDGEIQVMKDSIRRLQEQLELAQIDNANQVQQIANLQAKLDQIQQQIDQQ